MQIWGHNLTIRHQISLLTLSLKASVRSVSWHTGNDKILVGTAGDTHRGSFVLIPFVRSPKLSTCTNTTYIQRACLAGRCSHDLRLSEDDINLRVGS